MSRFLTHFGILVLLAILPWQLQAKRHSSHPHPGFSVFHQAPQDEAAVYLEPDGKPDTGEKLQEIVNRLKSTYGYGIIFVQEGEYSFTRTVYIPGGIRLIGYGKSRPVFRLADNAPGFRADYPDDKGKAKYLFWFTHSVVNDPDNVQDANSSTFYSALSNIDIVIGKGNPSAVALRTHYAQHSFITHCNIEIGDGKAGIFDVGNEIQDVKFYGGEVGIYTTRTSPSWQMTMLDVVFEGQRRSCILTEEGGWVIRRAEFRRSPIGIELQPDRSDKIYMEDCRFENISEYGILESREQFSPNQLSVRNVICSKVPVFAGFRDSGKQFAAPSHIYRVKELTAGLHLDDMASLPEFRTRCEMESLKDTPELPATDIPDLPFGEEWVNVRSLGVVGDGQTDDTEALRKAIKSHRVLYFPQGWYKVSQSLVLRPNTVLIGLNPASTQIFIDDSTPAFSGFGSPVPVLETPMGGNNIVNGIGLDTGSYNYRAVGCKWQAGADSYMNDVRFYGGHSIIGRSLGRRTGRVRIPDGVSTSANPVTYSARNKAYDNQHWSLWITHGGGGVFKDIWTPSAFSANGLYISDTDTPGTLYEVSVEHHVRNEVRLKNVHNWNFYALQLEEELLESGDVQPIDMQECSHLMFANLYLFRVIWIETPLRTAIRSWGCRDIDFYNVHNFTQMRYTTDVTMKDMDSGLEVMPWEFTRLTITGKEKKAQETGRVRKLVGGFEFLEGMARDSRGNVYFSEQRMRRIYQWDPQTRRVSLVADLPWQVLSLGCDTEDRLLVCIKYVPQPGYAGEGPAKDLSDAAGSTFSWWGNTGFEPRVYSIDPEHPEESVTPLPKKGMKGIGSVSKAYYPSHRWRDLNDFEAVCTYVPDSCFVALDGKTVIPEYYDLLRSSSLLEGIPGQKIFTSDEYNHRVMSQQVMTDATLAAPEPFSSYGEFSATSDGKKVFVAEGNIHVYDQGGKLLETVAVPERPGSIIVSGDKLYIAARTTLYEMDIR